MKFDCHPDRRMVRAEALYGNLALERLLHPVAFNPDGGRALHHCMLLVDRVSVGTLIPTRQKLFS